MTTKETGGPAFPTTQENYTSDKWSFEGMTLRDYFAAHASETDIKYFCPKGYNEEFVADCGNGRREVRHRAAMNTREQARYLYADAMLEARK